MMLSLPEVHHEEDPAEGIRKAVGDISNVKISPMQVLVGTYIRPTKTKSGIILGTGSIQNEDLYQGKVGLVLKVAPLAFEDDGATRFGGFSVKEGDWVVYRAADGFALSVNGHHCRLIEDRFIQATVESPDVIL